MSYTNSYGITERGKSKESGELFEVKMYFRL